MGRLKGRVSGGKKARKKVSFLEKQKKFKLEQQKQKNKKLEVVKGTRKAHTFETFSDEISKAEQSIVYQLAGSAFTKITDDTEKGSVFRATLLHWTELNLTSQFQNTCKQLHKFISLPQVVYGQSTITKVLNEGLNAATALSAQPHLELIAALATDLQHEFYPYLGSTIDIIRDKTLIIQDAKVIKWTFQCVAHLLKILWRPISSSDETPCRLFTVYDKFKPLFNINRPDYIRYLGGETLSFLVRKARNRREFYGHILAGVTKNTDRKAVAKLLFESVKTVNGQMNNMLEVAWPVMIDMMAEHYGDILLDAYEFALEHASSREVAKPILDLTLNMATQNFGNHEVLDNLLKCLETFFVIKQGKLTQDPSVITKFFTNAVETQKLNSDSLLHCIMSFTSASKIPRTSEETTRGVHFVLASDSPFSSSQKMKFTSHFFHEPIFDQYVLKPYLTCVQSMWKSAQSGEAKMEISTHLADFLRSRYSLYQLGSELVFAASDREQGIDLQLMPGLRKIEKKELFISDALESIQTESESMHLENCLMICGYLGPLDKKQVASRILSYLDAVVSSKDDQLLPTVPLAFQILSRISSKKEISQKLDMQKVITVFQTDNIALDLRLKILNFSLCCIDSLELSSDHCQLTLADLENLIEPLVSALAMPQSFVRELALHTLSIVLQALDTEGKFSTPATQPEGSGEGISYLQMLNMFLDAERTAANLVSFKTKINTLQRLNFDRVGDLLNCLPQDRARIGPPLVLVPIKYLLGSLYTNFTLLWAPLQDLIAGFAQGMKRDVFWPVFGQQLRRATEDIDRLVLDQIAADKYKRLEDANDRVDYIKYRNMLWSLMERFANLAETKNRELTPLFLDGFMKTEYVKIRTLSDDKEKAKDHNEIFKSTISSMLSHLTLFSKFKDLKNMHRQAELRSLVEDLLIHRVPSVQRIALEILATYKLKFLIPYKENLFNILDDKMFKSELLAFPLGEENSEIKIEHRTDLMPIILQLLYGRLRAVKTGKKHGGKNAITKRRLLVLHQLMDVSQDHLQYFFDLIFNELYLVEDGQKVTGHEEVISHVNNKATSAPDKNVKQLQVSIEMVEIILRKLGQLLQKDSLSYILRTLVWLGYLVAQIGQKNAKAVGLKSVKNQVYKQLSSFFIDYADKLELSPEMVEAVFGVFVWRPLETFESDYIHSTAGLLTLVLAWSKEPRWRHYLGKTHPNSGVRILENIVKVLAKTTASIKVKDGVLQVIHNLVTPIDIEDLGKDADDTQKANMDKLGIDLVLKELDILTSYFSVWIADSNLNVANLNRVGIKLDILIHLSPHITEAKIAEEFLSQLLKLVPSLKKSETIAKVLVICQKLVRKIANSTTLNTNIDTVLPFFGNLKTRQERLELSRLMNDIAHQLGSEDAQRVAHICGGLNAFDRRRVDEPDFEKRMAIFLELQKIRSDEKKGSHESEPLSCQALSAALYNCCFYVRFETDNSLRSNALDTLLSLTYSLAKLSFEENKKVIEKICLDQIRIGIKSKDDNVRCDFMSFLQRLVVNAADLNRRLKELAKLTASTEGGSAVDVDSDFFENIRHVQLHRRGRAMVRLAKLLDEDPKCLSQKNLTQLILPMSSAYLLNPDYIKNSQLIEQTIELLGAVCRALPWQPYEASLRFYMGMFTKGAGQSTPAHQKQLVKITSEILNAFHFDITLPATNVNNEGVDKWREAEKTDVDMDTTTAAEEEVEQPRDKQLELTKKIHSSVNNSLLPRLCDMLSGKLKGPVSISDEDALIQRVPLAVPIVRILQLNPPQVVRTFVPGIIAKIASFLKSKAIEIREAARTSLCGVVELLGARYLSFVIKELNSMLTRGYQIHVLTHTVHTLIYHLGEVKGSLVPGDLDYSINSLLQLALNEMFGVVAEEKEVKKIAAKLMEAKGTKSYDTLQLLAKYVSNNQLMAMVKPLSDKLSSLSSYKNIAKIKECFRNIVLGLLSNPSLDPLHCLLFIYGVITDKIELGRKTKGVKVEKPKIERNPDSYLIQAAPKRGGAVAKTANSATHNVLHEFGINLMFFLLKRGSVKPVEPEHVSRLSPFLPVLLAHLQSGYVTVVTVTLKVLSWLVRMPLASLSAPSAKADGSASTSTFVEDLTQQVFGLLRRYSGGTDSKGENHELVVAATKLLVVLVRDVSAVQLDDQHLKQLLDYVLIDVHDPLKQTTAFGLLSAVMVRKLESADLHEVILKMIELSIMSMSGQTRQAAKAAIITYIKNYKLGKKLGTIIDRCVAQLGYERESGRLMAADLVKSIISAVGPDSLTSHAQFLFCSMAPHLVNDESAECRRAITATVSHLVATSKPNVRTTLRSAAMKWYGLEPPATRQLACQLLSVFVEAAGGLEAVRPDLDAILERLPSNMRAPSDHLAIHAHSLLLKLMRSCPSELIRNVALWDAVHESLLHPHALVRLQTGQLIGLYLSQFTTDALVASLLTQRDKKAKKSKSHDPWLSGRTGVSKARSIILDSFEQLSLVRDAASEMGTQATKNLVALARVASHPDWPVDHDQSSSLPPTDPDTDGENEENGGKVEENGAVKHHSFSLLFICRRAAKLANHELVNTPKIVVGRTLVFSLYAAIVLSAEPSVVKSILTTILVPLQRELSSASANTELKNHCQEVVDLIKAKMEQEEDGSLHFNRIQMEVQLSLNRLRGQRTASKKQNLILRPDVAAKRKIQRNEAKKKAKKAKMQR